MWSVVCLPYFCETEVGCFGASASVTGKLKWLVRCTILHLSEPKWKFISCISSIHPSIHPFIYIIHWSVCSCRPFPITLAHVHLPLVTCLSTRQNVQLWLFFCLRSDTTLPSSPRSRSGCTSWPVLQRSLRTGWWCRTCGSIWRLCLLVVTLPNSSHRWAHCSEVFFGEGVIFKPTPPRPPFFNPCFTNSLLTLFCLN